MDPAEMASVEDLIRTILGRRGKNESHPDVNNDTSVEEILFDLEVDGSRYLVIRLPKSERLPVQLSPREREIVRLVALGHSNKIIADVLSISSWTVSTHLRRIFAKVGVGSRAAMVAHLAELGRSAAAGWSRKSETDEVDATGRDSSTGTITRGNNLRRVCV